MGDAFSRYHPLVNFLFFALVLAYSMVLMHPVCLAVSLLGALLYAGQLEGRRALARHLRVALPVLLLEVLMLGLGVGIIVSALTTKYRDLAIAVSFGVQLWMYISPVVYPLSSLEESPRLQMLMRLNPMTAPIEVFRMGTLGTGTVEVGSLIYSLYMMGNTMPLADQVYILQSNVIKELAAEGPCVILGRCGDYVLRERPNVLRTFVYAPLETRIQFAKSRPDAKDMPDRLWETQLAKHDRARASYYNYYTENRWGEAKNYDLCLNATLGREACADLIVAAARAMQEADK